jgi:hypothetical protein
MPEVAFIVTLNLTDVSLAGLEATASDIGEDLLSAGHDVVNAKAWQRPSLAATNLMATPQPEEGGLTAPPSLFGP